MVGLVSNTHLASIEKKIKKMSDTSGKEDVIEEKTDVPLSNGTESEIPKDEESEETKMDVDRDDEEKSKSLESKSTAEVVRNNEPQASNSNDMTPRRKSRSSRSQSSNSTSSVPPSTQNAESLALDDSKEKIDEDDNEEDFLGFESSDTQIECSKEKLQKIGDCIAQTDANDKLSFVGFSSSENNESKETTVNKDSESSVGGDYGLNNTIPETSFAENDLSSGLATPTSSTRKTRGFKKSINIDLSNPEFKKPFDYGWVRELVYRSTNDSSLRRNADIYYYTPSGKKVRSSREILEHLTGDLSLDNFSFFKEPIGLDDPTKEIIREAKTKPGPRAIEDGGPPVKSLTPKVKVTQVTPKVSPKDSSKTTNTSSSTSSSSGSTTPKVQLKGNSLVKNRSSIASKKFDKKRKSAGPDDVDVIMESPEWNSEQKTDTNGLKRPNDSPVPDSSPPEKKSKPDTKEDRLSSPIKQNPAHNFMMNLNAGFIALLHAFQYLKVFELLRAGCVSKMWKFVASHHSLWETVRMKNSRVSDWKGFARTLSSHGTKFLDLRKMLVPETPEEQTKMWEELCEAVKSIKTLIKVDLGRCSPAAFTAMADAAPQLESLVSLAIKGNEIDLMPVVRCSNLTELKIKAVSGGLEIKELSCLKELKNLTTLALTTIKNLQGIEDYLPEGLVSLELGECSNLAVEVATVALPKLKNLNRLRLEKGQNECPTVALLEAIATLPQLTQLELINFDVKPGFDKALAKCTNLKTLLIIPTYVTQSATTNHVVMGGVAKLSSTLTYFIWGLTLELLKVTDLFIGQVENQKSGKAGANPPKKGTGDSIPILKPSGDGEAKEGVGSQAPSQVDILALPNLQRVLSTLLPTTKIKILKVPFSATWRQTVTDSH